MPRGDQLLVDRKALLELLSYDRATGILWWNYRDRKFFTSDSRYKAWNKQHPGNEAFTAFNKAGYKVGAIFGRTYLAHRVIWLREFGCWPLGQIDHVNGVKDDNRITNLRDVSHIENGKNVKRSTRNSSGVTGIRQAPSGKWGAYIVVSKKVIHLGLHHSFAAAVEVRKNAEALHGFHPNHGRSA